MQRVFERMNEADMGDDFAEWADLYFSTEGTNLNREMPVNEAYINFMTESNSNDKHWNSKRFNKALKAFCENMNYTLNPPEKCGKDGHITMWHDGKATKMLFIRS